MMNEWGIPTFYILALTHQYASRLAAAGAYVPPIAIAGGFSMEDHLFKAIAMGAPHVRLVGMARAALTAVMATETIGRAVDAGQLPKHVSRHGSTREEVFSHYLQLQEEYADLGRVPDGAVGLYGYMTRLSQGLRQLMTGSRKFGLEYLSRSDLACLTQEAAAVSGIPFVNELDAEAVDRILAD